MIRFRSTIDEKHTIRDPWGPGKFDMEIWANTLAKTRIADLFRTTAGVPGHAYQIQTELNRLAKIEGKPGDDVQRAIDISRFLRNALVNAKEAHRKKYLCPLRRHSYRNDCLLAA